MWVSDRHLVGVRQALVMHHTGVKEAQGRAGKVAMTSLG